MRTGRMSKREKIYKTKKYRRYKDYIMIHFTVLENQVN